MTDVWDLTAYVEAHPGDLDQRWRLAKKLYTAFEYRLALEHLLVLKNEWGLRPNVCRYLAATYYRLGRYDEAIREMRNALDKFPDDVAMREQFARTLAVDNQKEEAVAQWEEVYRRKPDHRFAKRAISKLKRAIEKENAEKARLERAKAGEGLTVATLTADAGDTLCPSCGEKNTPEFKRCWKCHALLGGGAQGEITSAFTAPPRVEPARTKWPLLTGVLIAAMVALGVFLTLRGLAESGGGASGRPETVLALIESELLWTRIWLGIALVVVWPLAWISGAYLANVEERIYNSTLYQYGSLLALATYAMLWLPWRWIAAAAIAPVVFSIVMAFAAFQIPRGAAARMWLVQMASVAIISVAVIALRHGAGILMEAPAIVGYVARANEPAPYSSVLSAPGEIRVTWAPSGSKWLDRTASRVEIALEPGRTPRPVFLETVKPDGPPTYEQVRGERFVSVMETMQAGAPYTYRVVTKDPVRVPFTISGLLRPQVELAVQEAAPAGS